MSSEIKPWMWATLPFRSDPVEIVSYPCPQDGDDDIVMVRMKVGDPTSIEAVPAKSVAAFDPSSHEWSCRPRRRYGDNPTAFIFADEL